MKWLLIIVVLLIIGGVLYARSMRSDVGGARAQSHRLDDSSSNDSPHSGTAPPTTAEDVRPGDDDPLRPGSGTTA